MSFVSRSFSVEDLRRNFDKLLEKFRDIRARTGSGAPIESTKLWFYQRQLNSLDQMTAMDASVLLGIVNKYCSIAPLFDANNIIDIPEKKLLDLLDGKHILQDKDEKYNDVFFEIDMALRFAKKLGDGCRIDLSTDCDVVVSGEGLAIECKYLHSEKKFRNEFSDAMNQLERHLSEGLAKNGMVAYDLTSLVDFQVILEFAKSTFEVFAKNYDLIVKNRSIFSQEIIEKGVLQSVINDKNFMAVVSKFASHQADAVFYRNFKKSEFDKFSDNKVAVLYQFSYYLFFEYRDEVIPVPCRSMSYYINDNIPKDCYLNIKNSINSLAVGI